MASVHKTAAGKWRVRYRDDADRNRSRGPFDRKRDAERFAGEVERRRQTRDLAQLDAGRETLDEYVTGPWQRAYLAPLAPRTRKTYAHTYDKHISPRLGDVPLRDLDVEAIAGFQGDLIRAGVGPEATHKALTLLGGILQRAAEARRIPYNPARLVRKPRRPPREEVRPLAPSTVEALRGAVPQRDATVLSVLAYAGLRPGELRGLRWRDVRERTLLVNAQKTASRRTVRLLAPLAADLAEWRLASGRPAEDAPVLPGDDGDTWTAEGFNKWRGRVFARALDEARVGRARPYDLRHSFASLLLHEGRSVIYVARQLGHGAELTMRTYGHVIDELEDAPRQPAEDAIRAAREQRPFPVRSLRQAEAS